MSTSMFDNPGASYSPQEGFAFPPSLADKYKPKRLAEFLQVMPRNVMLNLLRNPKPMALYLVGGSGLGKTEMSLALANEMPAQLHHVASKDCDLDRVRAIRLAVTYVPHDMFHPDRRCKMHIVVIDEADKMTENALLAFLSILDIVGQLNTVFIFTGNARPYDPSGRFMSRCKMLAFLPDGMAEPITKLLASIWAQETTAPLPDISSIVRASNNNVRDAINSLEVELMGLPVAESVTPGFSISYGSVPVSGKPQKKIGACY